MNLPFIISLVAILGVAAFLILRRRQSSGIDPFSSARPGDAADARDFARLLVTEIRLYNPGSVEQGRLNRDLYVRLRSDIDRSREMYDKKVSFVVRAERDYFADALLDILADGDAEALAGYDGGMKITRIQ